MGKKEFMECEEEIGGGGRFVCPRAASERGWKGAIYPNQKHKQPGKY